MLFKLWRFDGSGEPVNEWDTARSMVVRAASEEHARQIASAAIKDLERHERDNTAPDWLDPARTRCVCLEPNGSPEIILVDYLNG